MNNLFDDVVKDIDKNFLSNDMDAAANAFRMFYDSFKRAGFTANQSLELTKEMMRTVTLIACKGEGKG